ncbi:MAG: hypothetical protein ACK50A_07190 [Sphingobacteriaceae bacterium]|jgi:hypothetical protein
MKNIFLAALILFSVLGFSQSFNFIQKRKIKTNIEKIDNSQFLINHHEKANFKIESKPAEKLIAIGKPATAKLIDALGDPNKVIVAHLILCNIYLGKATFAGPKEFTADSVTYNKYFLGEMSSQGLIISETKKKNEYNVFIVPKDQEDIINYWKRKTEKKKN